MTLILKQKTSPIRSIYLPEATLMSLAGVGAYQFDAITGSTTRAVGYTPGEGAFQYYETTRIPGQGSWWFPTATVNFTPLNWNDTSLGGITTLKASGQGIWVLEGENRVVRPAELFWWIPQSILTTPAFPLVPAENLGLIKGIFPQEQPGGTPAKPTVETTSSGFLITVPPGNESTKVTLARESASAT